MTVSAHAIGQRVLNAVQAVTDVPWPVILGGGRSAESCSARFAVIFILHRKYHWSFCRIGKRIGRDHSTVLAAVQQVDGRRPMGTAAKIALEISLKAESILDGIAEPPRPVQVTADISLAAPPPVLRIDPPRQPLDFQSSDVLRRTPHGVVTMRGEIILAP